LGGFLLADLLAAFGLALVADLERCLDVAPCVLEAARFALLRPRVLLLALRDLVLALRDFVLLLRALVLMLRDLEPARFFVVVRPRAAFLLELRDFVLALRDLERFTLEPRGLEALRALPVARFLVL